MIVHEKVLADDFSFWNLLCNWINIFFTYIIYFEIGDYFVYFSISEQFLHIVFLIAFVFYKG